MKREERKRGEGARRVGGLKRVAYCVRVRIRGRGSGRGGTGRGRGGDERSSVHAGGDTEA